METFVQSYFEDCHISFLDDAHKHLSINARFTEEVGKLASQADCAKFIQKFGTHYAHEVTFGGRMYQRIKISTKTYQSLKKSGTNVSAKAEGTYKNITASAGSSSSSSSSSEFASQSGVSVEDIKWVGGTPSTNFNEWVKTIRKDPKPVQMVLRPLYDLLTKTHFKNDSKISDKRKWLEDSTVKYIKENAYIAPDLTRLANRRFQIRNRWRADVGERRVNKHLSFSGNNVELYDEKNTKDLVPWLLIPVPGTVDQFYIQNKWHEESKNEHVDKFISFTGADVTLCTKGNTSNIVPWQFTPVPGRPDEYYIRSRWNAEKGDKYTDFHMSFTDDSVKLYDKDNRYDLAPWQLKEV
ncbi:hypothetical protein MFUL124B02_17690 [Myxococcus fulvus 124B02]|nr:hypothetical protein MFUL124B02_17690 [Myxococcus fulvus 124B02]